MRKTFKSGQAIYTLLKELVTDQDLNIPEHLATKIKCLEIEVFNSRGLSEAISTAGGISFLELSKDLEVISIPGMYIGGEMLDFEAPTGGYLLQGCFSTAWRIVSSIKG